MRTYTGFFRGALLLIVSLLSTLPALAVDVLIQPGRSQFVELARSASWATLGRGGVDNTYVLVPSDPDVPGCVQIANKGAADHNVTVQAYGTWDPRVTQYEPNPSAWTLLSNGAQPARLVAAGTSQYWRVPPTGGARLAIRVFSSDGVSTEKADLLLNFSKTGMCGTVAYAGNSVVGGAYEGDPIPSTTTTVQPLLLGARSYNPTSARYEMGALRQTKTGALWVTTNGCLASSQTWEVGPGVATTAGGIVAGASTPQCLVRIAFSNPGAGNAVVTVTDGSQTLLFTVPSGDTKVYEPGWRFGTAGPWNLTLQASPNNVLFTARFE